MADQTDIEHLVRTRLRTLRQTMGFSLDDLAVRTHLSPSTISRIETGKRTVSLDVLVPLARALQVDLEALLDVDEDDDVVIRPVPSHAHGRTTWMLNRPTGSTVARRNRFTLPPHSRSTPHTNRSTARQQAPVMILRSRPEQHPKRRGRADEFRAGRRMIREQAESPDPSAADGLAHHALPGNRVERLSIHMYSQYSCSLSEDLL